MMFLLTKLAAALSLLLGGAIFGFFYSWLLWGFDALDPNTAITTVRTMNASVREVLLAPIFLGTPIVLLLTALSAVLSGVRPAAAAFGVAFLIYMIGAFLPTVQVSVRMIDALGALDVPSDITEAGEVWAAYSERFQFWNVIRTLCAGAALLAVGRGILLLPARAS